MRGAARALAAGVALAAAGRAAGAQNGTPAAPRVRVVDVGRGGSGRLLREALARPAITRVAAGGARVELPRDSSYASTVIVIGAPSAAVGATVHGDVIVVGGDLFLHPGAQIDGRAVAIGGCVYNSTLAVVRGERVCFRDNTFDVGRGAGGETTLAYRALSDTAPAPFSLAGFQGFRIPAYDRVNGLSLGWGPSIWLDRGRVSIAPVATYRSDLGDVDPSVQVRLAAARRTALLVTAARGTYTNEGWIRSDAINGLGAFGLGSDARNYFRADRIDARALHTFETETGALDVYAGAATERAWSVGPEAGAVSRPFSVFGRDNRTNGMLRPNPQGTTGRVSSALAGALGTMRSGDLSTRAAASIEVPFDAPGGGRWVQAVLDGGTNFPTFGTQRADVSAHAVLTAGDDSPRQRYHYLGGSGTLPTEDLLLLGGDMLFFVDGLYVVPLEFIRLPFVGSPVGALRYTAGSAGVRSLPAFTQNIGARLSVSLARVEVMVNPATRDASVSLGVGMAR